MAYDIFSQPQGPNIDTSLFVNAADRGYRTGYDIGSTLSNAVEGAVSGYRQGQAIYSESQQQQIRQNQIEQLPVENAYRQEQLEALRRKNEMEQLDAEFQKNNQKLIEDAKLAELRAKAAESNQKVQDIQTLERLNSVFSSNDALAKQAAFNDPNNQAYLRRNPKVFESVVANLITTTPTTPDQRKQIYTQLDASKVLADEQALQRKKEEDKLKAQQEYPTKRNAAVASSSILNDVRTTYPNDSIDQIIRNGELKEVAPRAANDLTGAVALPRRTNFRYKDKEIKDVSDEFVKAYAAAKAASLDLEYSSSTEQLDKIRQQDTLASSPEAPAPEAPTATEGVDPIAARKQRNQSLQNRMLKAESTRVNADVTDERVVPAPFAVNPVENAKMNKVLNPALHNENPLVKALAFVESSGNANAISKNKEGKPVAYGLMQILPGTFNDVVRRYDLKDKNLLNPKDNVEVGKIYLAEQLVRFGTEPGAGLELALAAYNAGPGRIQDALTEAEDKSWRGVKEQLRKTAPKAVYEQAAAYPDKVLKQLMKIAVPASTFFGGIEESAEETYPSSYQEEARGSNFNFPEEGNSINSAKLEAGKFTKKDLVNSYVNNGWSEEAAKWAVNHLPRPKKRSSGYLKEEDEQERFSLYSQYALHDQPLPFPVEYYTLEDLRRFKHKTKRYGR